MEQLPVNKILKTWWPLAASWLLMGIEGPALSAIMARLPNAEINLAAYGGIVFPIMLIIEAPIIMLLAASTALCTDWISYRKVYRFMMTSIFVLTAIHILTAFTPLYYFLVENVISVPPEIVEPARIGLMIMTPWTGSIAFRRFQQGVMIRFNCSEAVGVGTIVRLLADGLSLALGYWMGNIPGIVVATGAQALGVISEAIFAGLRVKPIIKYRLRPAKPGAPISWKSFAKFYIPLALTSVISLIWQPIGSAALSRMNMALESLAVWPVVSGLVFMLRSPGMAYNETVVALLDCPKSYPSLKKFTGILLVSISLIHLLFAATPLADLWFGKITALNPALVTLAMTGFWLSLPMPGLNVLQSWYQGAIVHGKNTRGIPEAMAVFLVTAVTILIMGVFYNRVTGLYVGCVAFTIANITQTTWLWVRSRREMNILNYRDSGGWEPEGLKGV